MDVESCRRSSGHIPAFGNWDYANDLPITQYFDSARQAGLIRFCDHPTTTHTVVASSGKKRGSQVAGRRRNNTNRYTSSNLTTAAAAAAQVKEENKVVKSQQQQQKKHMYASAANEKKKIISNSFKPEPDSEPVVDEDLYKIPPHLLHTSKRVCLHCRWVPSHFHSLSDRYSLPTTDSFIRAFLCPCGCCCSLFQANYLVEGQPPSDKPCTLKILNF